MEPKNFEITSSDWSKLRNLRSHFLSETLSVGTDYWDSSELLELYHQTFAQRIGWKWDAVLNENRVKNLVFKQKKVTLLDYGCGTGMAAEKMINFLGSECLLKVQLWDRSQRAREFAQVQLGKKFPALCIESSNQLGDPREPLIVCLSHVLNEISKAKLGEVIDLISQANFVFWVEPGTSDVSNQLIWLRKKMLQEMTVVSPCPHQGDCGMASLSNQNHWCHFFASPPTDVFHSSFWRQFSRELSIDLRSLPTSYLVLEKGRLPVESSHSRVIGRPRIYKGYGKFLLCNDKGVGEVRFLEKKQKELLKLYKHDVFCKEIEFNED